MMFAVFLTLLILPAQIIFAQFRSNGSVDISGFGGLDWGTPAESTLLTSRSYSARSSQTAVLQVYTRSQFETEYLGLKAETSYGFIPGSGLQWGQAKLTFNEADRDAGTEVLTKLIGKYGTPRQHKLRGSSYNPHGNVGMYVDQWRRPTSPGMPNATEIEWSDAEGDVLHVRLDNDITVTYMSNMYIRKIKRSDY
jgi:hypothetical protein